MSWTDLLTDKLVRHFWWEKWYGDTKGIVEYLAEWAGASDPEKVKRIGVCIVVIIAMLVGWKGAQIFQQRPRKKGERKDVGTRGDGA